VEAFGDDGSSLVHDTAGTEDHEDIDEHGNGTDARPTLGRVAEH